ncbi:hypothetical protein EV356DRAFT_566801 [Viridothelium virens]|uniref:Zn(2)-C6 fungal-type domain-containing protein n=1 Tax=Viridothelium virens TaxID=1048519 RepID=A0A6A6HAN9_VIRVR|nr:hypothetical protein EV356DRAFT_566801 [Viridothelium virens]
MASLCPEHHLRSWPGISRCGKAVRQKRRIRKVKCDEGRPACRRCVSTGRNCDGYGIWGGGGYAPSYRSDRLQRYNDVPHCPIPVRLVSAKAASAEDKAYLDWFKCRTSLKLPGIFVLTFWKKLVFQASVDEPAVLHAILALSAAHKSEVQDGNRLGGQDSLPNEQEKSMLQHYSKAINYLQHHCVVDDRSLTRISLIACILFFCLELLRGRYRTAQTHLRNGVELLRVLYPRPTMTDDGIILVGPSPAPIDDWVAEVLLSLHLRAALFNPLNHNVFFSLQAFESELPASSFRSLHHAKLRLDRLVNKVLSLKNQYHQQNLSDNVQPPPTLLVRQHRIQVELAFWLNIHNASKANHWIQPSPFDEFVSLLLLNHHAMLTLMVSTSGPHPTPETRFDQPSHTAAFRAIISRSGTLWRLIRTPAARTHATKLFGAPPAPPSHPANPNANTNNDHPGAGRDAVVEMGWIPPLYYTAIKCRVPHLRRRALALLGSSLHREGIWAAGIVGPVARRVMEMEEGEEEGNEGARSGGVRRGKWEDGNEVGAKGALEGGLEEDAEEEDELWCGLDERGLRMMPVVPEGRRMRDVGVTLPDEPGGKVGVRCTRRRNDGVWEVMENEYDVSSGCWRDKVEGSGKSIRCRGGLFFAAFVPCEAFRHRDMPILRVHVQL